MKDYIDERMWLQILLAALLVYAFLYFGIWSIWKLNQYANNIEDKDEFKDCINFKKNNK